MPSITASGSSPRVRGTPLARPTAVRATRFIPACAGNSGRSIASMRRSTVHPRVCGELIAGRPERVQLCRFIPACAGNSRVLGRSRLGHSGSSPRVRGTLVAASAGRCGERFIPACAGNSTGVATDTIIDGGSSPRVRGTLAGDEPGVAGRRFIPACAGNSLGAGDVRRRAPVHPRVCGELTQSSPRGPFATGSSPRVRGTRLAPDGLRR